MQGIDDGIAPFALFGVARWQINEHVAVCGTPFEISFERRSVDFNSFDSYRLRAGFGFRNFGLDLTEQQRDCGEGCEEGLTLVVSSITISLRGLRGNENGKVGCCLGSFYTGELFRQRVVRLSCYRQQLFNSQRSRQQKHQNFSTCNYKIDSRQAGFSQCEAPVKTL